VAESVVPTFAVPVITGGAVISKSSSVGLMVSPMTIGVMSAAVTPEPASAMIEMTVLSCSVYTCESEHNPLSEVTSVLVPSPQLYLQVTSSPFPRSVTSAVRVTVLPGTGK